MSDRPYVELNEETVRTVAAMLLDRRQASFRDQPVVPLLGEKDTEIVVQEVEAVLREYMLRTSRELDEGYKEIEREIGALAFDSDSGLSEERKKFFFRVYSAFMKMHYREEARRRDPLSLDDLSILIENKLRTLDDLYTVSGQDWAIDIHRSLTEPTCPSVAIRPDFSNATRYLVHRDSIVGGIFAAVDLVHAEMIEGKPVQSEAMWTNPDDHTWPRSSSAVVDTDDLRALQRAYEAQIDRVSEMETMLGEERATRQAAQARIAELEAELLALKSV